MTKKEIREFLEGQLKKLQEAHVSDLMRALRHEELEEILKDIELDFSPIEEFFNETENAIYQCKEEIPKMLCYELALYMQQSGLEDNFFFEDYGDYQTVLIELEDEGVNGIVEIIDREHLCDCTVEELMGDY